MREMERSNASSSPCPSRRFFLLALLSSLFFLFIFFLIISRFFALGWHRRHVADFLWSRALFWIPNSQFWPRRSFSRGIRRQNISRVFYKTGFYAYAWHAFLHNAFTMSRYKGTSALTKRGTAYDLNFFLVRYTYVVLETYLLLLTISALVDAKMQGNVLDLMKNWRTHIYRDIRELRI